MINESLLFFFLHWVAVVPFNSLRFFKMLRTLKECWTIITECFGD